MTGFVRAHAVSVAKNFGTFSSASLCTAGVDDAITIVEESAASLEDYGRVSIAYLVTSRVRASMDGGWDGQLHVEAVDPPYIKDYDTLEGPVEWARRWDVSRWGVLAAYSVDRQRIGGAVVAGATAGVDMLEGRDDLAVLWDLRLSPEFRGRGIGTRLFRSAAEWARRHGYCELRVETQDVNVPACRFYAAMGARLISVRAGACAAAPGEV